MMLGMTRGGWAGTTLADRRADRRRRLLDVGLDLLGSRGSAAVSVRSVCRTAQLTDRYFYESFAAGSCAPRSKPATAVLSAFRASAATSS